MHFGKDICLEKELGKQNSRIGTDSSLRTKRILIMLSGWRIAAT
jgi:hypothetical protein